MSIEKQIKLAIYKYFVVETSEQHLFREQRPKCEALESVLNQSKLPMVRKKRGSNTPEPLPIADCKYQDGIAVIKLQKNRERKAVNEYKDGKIEDHPWCWVVMDNRPGVGQMAVQYKSEFGTSDAAVKIIEESFHALLSVYGLKLEIKAKVQEGEFWDTIERLYEKGDHPRSLKFDFPGGECKDQLDKTGIPDNFVDFQMRLMEVMQVKNGIKSILERRAVDGHELDLHREKVSDDMAHLITLFCNNGYDLRVSFARFGEYQLGKKMRAWREIRESSLEQFMDGEVSFNEQTGEPEYGLEAWLDEVRDSTKLLTDEDIVKLRTTRRGKKSA